MGNIQLRNIQKSSLELCSVTRDAEEIIMSSFSKNDEEIVGFCTDHLSYVKLYSQFMVPYSW